MSPRFVPLMHGRIRYTFTYPCLLTVAGFPMSCQYLSCICTEGLQWFGGAPKTGCDEAWEAGPVAYLGVATATVTNLRRLRAREGGC